MYRRAMVRCLASIWCCGDTQAKDEELHITAKQLKSKVAELQEEIAALAAQNKALVLSSLRKRWVSKLSLDLAESSLA